MKRKHLYRRESFWCATTAAVSAAVLTFCLLTLTKERVFIACIAAGMMIQMSLGSLNAARDED